LSRITRPNCCNPFIIKLPKNQVTVYGTGSIILWLYFMCLATESVTRGPNIWKNDPWNIAIFKALKLTEFFKVWYFSLWLHIWKRGCKRTIANALCWTWCFWQSDWTLVVNIARLLFWSQFWSLFKRDIEAGPGQ